MHGFIGTDIVDAEWRVDKYPDMADFIPRYDTQEHLMGDECWCAPTMVKPRCGGCGQQHFVIVSHNSMRRADVHGRDASRDTLIALAMQER